MTAFRITPINVSMDGAGVRFAPVPTTTVGGVSGVRIADMPDLGTFDGSSSIVGEKSGSGRFSAASLGGYFLPITSLGYEVGMVPGPWVATTAGVTTYPSLQTTHRLIFERAVNAPTDNTDFHFRRYTNFTGGTTANINTTLRVDTITGPGDGAVSYGIVCATTNGSTVGGRVQSAVIQSWKTAGSGVCTALNTSANEQQLTPSSLSGPVTCQEWDLYAGGVDDGGNSNRFGAVGLRQIIHAAFSQQSQTVVSHYTAGIWFSTQAISDGGSGTISSYADSLICAATKTQIRSFLDTRGAIPPTGVTDPVAAVRMPNEHIIDFNGGAALTSPPGNYLQYTETVLPGDPRLRYMVGASERFSIDDNGNVEIAGQLGLATTTPPSAGIQLDVGGTNTVGIRLSGTFTTAVRISADSRLAFTATDSAYMQYRAATGRIYYVVAGVDMWSVDASGNVRAKGTVTGSTTP